MCYSGFVVQAIVNNFLPILFIIFQTSYGLKYEQLGRIILVNFGVQIFADLATPLIARSIGYRYTAAFSQFAAAVGLGSLAFFPHWLSNTYAAILLSVMIYAFGSGMMEVILSPIVELLPTRNKGANMAFLHSFYCWGQAFTVLVTTTLVWWFGYDAWQNIPLIWAILPLINAVLFLRAAIIEPQEEKQKNSVKSMFFQREFICFAIFMLCAGSSEIAMAQWASVFVQRGLGVEKFIGDLLGPCAFAIFMGTGRIIYGTLSGKYSVKKVLIFNNILCLMCYAAVGLFQQPILSLLACALCGFSVSLSWPGTYSLATVTFPNGGTAMFGFFAFCGDCGCAVGPWILGVLADRIGMKNGFLACTVFPLIMILAAVFLLKEKK
ncbi:MAG: MFS transporter [Clostridia bacterium]|nr:MFS transporter [Clostridia bacterium]